MSEHYDDASRICEVCSESTQSLICEVCSEPSYQNYTHLSESDTTMKAQIADNYV